VTAITIMAILQGFLRCSRLVFLLKRVERILADEALALGKVDRKRVLAQLEEATHANG